MSKHANIVMFERLMDLVNGWTKLDITREYEDPCLNPRVGYWTKEEGLLYSPQEMMHVKNGNIQVIKIAGSFTNDNETEIINIGGYQESDGDTTIEFKVYANRYKWIIERKNNGQVIISGDNANVLWKYICKDLKPYELISLKDVNLEDPLY